MADNLTNKLDLVDRGAIIEKLLDMHFYPAIVKSVIEKAPAVDAEIVRYGHWEMDEQGDCKCSACGEWQTYPDNYCRECGAKMYDEAEDT